MASTFSSRTQPPRKRSPHFALPALVAISFSAALSVGAQEAGESTAPERIDLANFPGVLVDRVVVPIPAEIFAVLDKLDEPNWSGGIRIPPSARQSNERAILALTFGSIVGEGFVAVQARSVDDIQQIGRRALSLSESLGLANAVRPHSMSIIEAADRRQWDKVREELDSTQQTVRTTMERLRDDELAGLVSLGGWLRGTHVVTSFISESFRDDKAELLNQPGLISHFRRMLDSMSGPSAASPQIRAISDGLGRMEAIISAERDISEADIAELRDISLSLLELYYFEPSEEAPGGAND